MPRIVAFAVHAVELPFRLKFEHAAASRGSSESLFVELTLEDGTVGWGESLPRPYVTGETRDGACEMLASAILPRLLGQSPKSFEEIVGFLTACDGRAPAEWVDPLRAQSAAWSAVDLALLDAYGRHFGKRPFGDVVMPDGLLYSGVLSAGRGWKRRAQLLAFRLLGFRELKVKIDATTKVEHLARIRRLVGAKVDLRVDVNMGWDVAQALQLMPALGRYGIRSFEQPLGAGD